MLATVAPAAPQVPGRFDLPPSRLRQARSTLLRQARSIFGQAADGLGPDPELRIEFGEPAERLTSLAQREHAGLLVVGVPDRPAAARRLLGSVYLALAGTSPCPVVVVPPSVEELPRTAGPIVCGVDGSDGSLAAAGVAVELARRLEARVELVHVTDRPPLDRDYATRLVASHDAAMRVLLRTANLPQAALDLRVELGRPAQRLADVAAREEAPLIVNGSQGSGFDRSALLGSVSSELALTATQPLVLVPLLASAGRLDHAHKRAEQLADSDASPRSGAARAGHPASAPRPGGGEQAVSALVEVLHFADAACPWDYSAEPVRVALEERYGAQLRWRTVQVGLHESGAAMASRGFTTERLREAYRDFQRRLGMPFCTAPRPGLHGSWAAGRMIKAAEMQSHGAGAALLRRLRLAWFLEVRPTDEPEVLLALAAELDGVDVGRLRGDFAREASVRALRLDMALARRPDRVALALGKTARPTGEPGPRFSTPTYVLLAGGRTATVPGFQPLEAYEVALHNLAPGLERRPAPDPIAFLERRAGQPHAAVEVAAATGRTPEEAIAALDELGKRGRVLRLDVGGEGALWCAGAPATELRCAPASSAPEPVARELAA